MFWNWGKEFPSTNARIVVTLFVFLWTAYDYLVNGDVPVYEWLAFLIIMAGIDYAQFRKKRETFNPSAPDAKRAEQIDPDWSTREITLPMDSVERVDPLGESKKTHAWIHQNRSVTGEPGGYVARQPQQSTPLGYADGLKKAAREATVDASLASDLWDELDPVQPAPTVTKRNVTDEVVTE